MGRDTFGGGSDGLGGGSGAGLPSGGSTGQVLAKASNTDGDVSWQAGSVPSDATTGAKGIVQLAGDLAGTAASPQIATGVIVNADVNASAAIAESKLNLASDAAAGTASRRTLGTSGTSACAGNDARLTDTRTPTDSSVTVAKLASGALSSLKAVALHNGTSYPSRPTGFASVEWIGPTDPGGSAQDGDTWVPTAGP
jgi:hypothetical protein